MNIEEYEKSQNGGEPEADISKIDFSKAVEEPLEQETQTEIVEPEKKEETTKTEETKVEDKKDAEPPAKKVQTPEENAKFAEQRRQQQVDKRVQDELARLKASDPAYKLAETMQKMYDLPIDQIHAKIQEAMIQEEAKQRNVPVETIRAEHAQQQTIAQQQAEVAQNLDKITETNFKLWEHRMQTEAAQIKQELPMLTDEDFAAAQEFMLVTLKNAELPLEQVVNMIHGTKIRQGLVEIAKNEALAKIAGRTPDALPPIQGKVVSAPTLTDEEKYAAKHIFKMSEEDYLKYKSN